MLNIGNRIAINSLGKNVAEDLIMDGSTKAWFQYNTLITKNGADLVSLWGDKSGNGNDLIQATETNRPTWNANGILFDGIDNFMKCVAFTLAQPETIYIVFKQVTWTSGDRIFDGNAAQTGAIIQASFSPVIKAHAGSDSSNNSNLVLDTYGIARIQFNGASSTIQVNETTQITGNFGANNMGGFTLGARGTGLSQYSNIEVKEVIIRNVADTSGNETIIYNYLANKYGI